MTKEITLPKGGANPSDEYKIRLQRLAEIKKAGFNPYPGKARRSFLIGDVLSDFKNKEKSKIKISIAGRIRSLRLHGGSCFIHLEDGAGKIQAYFKKDEVGNKQYRFFTDSFDVGDFIEIQGALFVTKRGEQTILAKKFKLLSKALLPLPEKWHGLADVETRFRKRYLDLLSNPEVKKIFIKRSKIIQYLRDYFLKNDFLEVDTPILQQVASGAIAKPFKTRHQALNTDLFLRIAPELYLKELVIGGFDKVFELARCFRNEGIDYAHNPEFTQIEFYWAYKDYNDLMAFTEKMLSDLVKDINGSTVVDYDNQKIDFKPPYPRIDFREALIKECKIDLDKHDAKSLIKEAVKKGLKPEKHWGKGKIADELFKEYVRPKMINPTFLINHPVELSPLSKKIEQRPNYVERFQLIVGGKIELLNAFTELNDPLEQEERFKLQQGLSKKGDEEAMGKDDEFVEALKYGLPPTAGFGMGIDRLVNVLTNTHSIKEVILFPTLKPEK
ncbi:lysine--tRNA ligase [Patescibacteria group bacterium]|nr:lysine--tRNA ligase [Patescibacteria group bacterium]